MSNSKEEKFGAPLSKYFTVEVINAIIALLSCIFAVSELKTTITFSEFIGERTPGLLMFSPMPLSGLILGLVKSIVLLAGGFTLLIKKPISLRIYHFYCIFILAEGFIWPFNKDWLFLNGLYYFVSTTTVISIILLVYFNKKKVLEELKPKKKINAKEVITYIALSYAIIFLAFFLRSLFYEEYELSFFH